MPEPIEARPRPASTDRRNFFGQFLGLWGWAAFATWTSGLAVGALRFMFPKIRYEAATRFVVGRPADYLVDTVDTRWLKERGLFMVRGPRGIYALSSSCTHLGCTITWFASQKWFKCPCHGSFFDIEGDVIGGPAPEPLRRAAIAMDEEGHIVVDAAQSANKPGIREKGNFMLKA